MKYSEVALQVLVAKDAGMIRSNAHFWKEYYEESSFKELVSTMPGILNDCSLFSSQHEFSDVDEGFICAYDKEFPIINRNAKNSDKPYLLFYRGNIDLLKNLNNNVAVIGLLDPTEEIEKRERSLVEQLVQNGVVIVSGLAKGCDSIAHKVCVEKKGNTIAILPSTLQKISPAANRKLADDIVLKGGLLLTEYHKEPLGRHELIKRYVERDRLQALFSKAIILTASYRKGEGDSGSRHAMESAKSFGISRYVMYNEATDFDDKQFGLNKDMLNSEENVKHLCKGSINEIVSMNCELLDETVEFNQVTQLTLF